jgi:hypothetical protein
MYPLSRIKLLNIPLTILQQIVKIIILNRSWNTGWEFYKPRRFQAFAKTRGKLAILSSKEVKANPTFI